MKPSDYHGIALWDKQLGRKKRYTEKEQTFAAQADAPLDAIYCDAVGNWICVSDLAEDHPFRADYARYLGKQTQPPPVPASVLSNLRMVAGNEKKYSRVIQDGHVLHWVSLGWVNEGPAQPADFEVYPEVTD